MKKTVSEGRSAPGYSYQANGTKVPDEQIQEWLMELISSDGFAYGYRKLNRLLAPRIPVTDQ
ncbi:hypothetical protein P7H17_23730 [Paenibacillus larvae]|nr:hypothetical protein [Paenibacillus larvae]MDT2288453.1 hypothetical protein [Paenibacillus larvae]